MWTFLWQSRFIQYFWTKQTYEYLRSTHSRCCTHFRTIDWKTWLRTLAAVCNQILPTAGRLYFVQCVWSRFAYSKIAFGWFFGSEPLKSSTHIPSAYACGIYTAITVLGEKVAHIWRTCSGLQSVHTCGRVNGCSPQLHIMQISHFSTLECVTNNI